MTDLTLDRLRDIAAGCEGVTFSRRTMMAIKQFTRWKATRRTWGGEWLIESDDPRDERSIANVFGFGDAEAVARLIAAAPEMLEALQEAADFVQPFSRDEDFIDRLEAIIAKATAQ